MTIKIKWESEITKIRKDLHTLQKENVKLQEKLRGVTKESAKGTKAQDALGRAAKRVYREIETPAQRYNRKMQELNRLLKAGKINEDQFGRAGQRARNQLADSTIRINRLQDQARSGAASWALRLASVVGSYVSLRTVIAGVTREIEIQDEMRRKSRDLAKSLGDVQRETLVMLGRVPQQEREVFVKQMEKLAAELQPEGGLRTVYTAMAAALSAGGGDVPKATAAMRQAIRIAPQSSEAITMTAQAIMDLSKATGTTQARQNLGFLLGVAQQARVTSMRDISQYMTRGVIGVSGFGGTAQEAGAIVAAITQAAGDPHGRISSTAAIGLVQQLDKYFGMKRQDVAAVAKLETGEVLGRIEQEAVKKVRAAEEAGGYLRIEAPKMTPLQMIQYMRTHPEARAEFMATLSTEKVTAVPVQQMLGVEGRGDVAYRFLEQALPKMVKGKEAAELVEEMTAGIDALFEQRLAKSERRAEQTREELLLTPEGRERAIQGRFTKETLQKDLETMGVGGFKQWLAGRAYWVNTLFGMTAQEAYQREMGLYTGFQGTREQRRGAERFLGESTTTDDLLQQVLDEIKTQTDLMRQAEDTREQPDVIGSPQGAEQPSPWGLMNVPGGGPVIVNPQDPTAEVGFSTN